MIINFNDNWTFKTETGTPEKVCLPHDAMIIEKRSPDCLNGVNSGYFHGGKYTYEKSFEIKEEQIGKSIELHFGGVYQNCTVFINGKEVGSHKYGYTPFSADISDFVAKGENTVTVKDDNSLEPNCRWYSGSGIYRDVNLVVREKAHIKSVRIETVSISPAVIKVSVDSPNEAEIKIYDGDTLVAEGTPGEITIPDAKLWSAETPNLYRCKVITDTDEVSEFFGIRELKWSHESGLKINGKRVLLRGGCIHHDNGVLGACEYYDAAYRRIKILKENGFNAVRIAHNPASKEVLEACDKLGMYVMNESFDGWYIPKTYHDYARYFETQWKGDISSMVETSFNHPCVIMYSVGNEVTETATKHGGEVCAEMTAYTHLLDSTRPVTAGINVLLNVYSHMGIGVYKDKGDYKPEPLTKDKRYKEKKTGSALFNAFANKLGKLMFIMSTGKKGSNAIEYATPLDIVGLNYGSGQYDYQVSHFPERIFVGSETMVSDLPYNWERVKKYPQLVGDFVWAAWDYLGEACIGDWTYHSYKGLPLLAGQGMIDITGKPLAAMAFMQTVWGLRKEPFICVKPLNHAHETPSTGAWQFTNAIDSWSWEGYEGVKAEVEVFADADFVTLELGGKPIVTKAVKDFKTKFNLPYAPGILTAKALDKNKNVISESSLKTGKSETVLSVNPEKSWVNKNELCYIPIEFTDSEGILKPYIEQRVTIEIEGNAELLGFGSALCKTDEVFNKNYHNAHRGRCLAVIKAGNTEGAITVKVSSQGVNTTVKTIEVK